jgi:phosphoribosylaminoimidazolecarboxamide formyltransferase/IMP cyclohydrolase
MPMNLPIRSALISVFYKDGLEPVVRQLHQLGVQLYSTGGTQSFIEQLASPALLWKALPVILPSSEAG